MLAEIASGTDDLGGRSGPGAGDAGRVGQPSGRDKVMGLWRPLAPDPLGPPSQASAAEVESSYWPRPRGRLRQAAIRAASRSAMKEAGPLLIAVVSDKNSSDSSRAEALKGLDRIQDPERIELARKVLDAEGGRRASRLCASWSRPIRARRGRPSTACSRKANCLESARGRCRAGREARSRRPTRFSRPGSIA